jgi:hypothetical protein
VYLQSESESELVRISIGLESELGERLKSVSGASSGEDDKRRIFFVLPSQLVHEQQQLSCALKS